MNRNETRKGKNLGTRKKATVKRRSASKTSKVSKDETQGLKRQLVTRKKAAVKRCSASRTSKVSKDETQGLKRQLVTRVLLFLWRLVKKVPFVKRVLLFLWRLVKKVPFVKRVLLFLWRLVKKVPWCTIWSICGLLAACIAIWIAVTPRVFVYPSVSLDPASPMFTMFVVRNEGYLAIRDVKFEYSIDSLTLADGTQVKAEVPYDNSFSDPNQVARVIDPGEEWSELLSLSGLEHKFKSAELAVVVSFRPYKWLSRRQERKHRFETRVGKYGQWHWFPQPINK